MTYEEALDVLMNKIQIDVKLTEDFNRDYDCLVKCKEAIEKQILKKPLPDNESYLEGICPTCGVYFLDRLTKHCGNCGQALDWSEEE